MKKNLFLPIRYLKVILIILLLFAKTNSYSQTNNINAYAVFDDSIRAAGQTGGYICLQNVDTINLVDIQVIVGSSESDSSIYNAVFSYSSGVGFVRDKDNIRIEVASNVQAPWTYFCKVLVNNSGAWSIPFIFLAN